MNKSYRIGLLALFFGLSACNYADGDGAGSNEITTKKEIIVVDVKLNEQSINRPKIFSSQIFTNKNKNISVIYTSNSQINIRVNLNNNEVFNTSFSADYRSLDVNFLDLNNDSVEDMIIELADETGFRPMILLSTSQGRYDEALKNHSYFVEYTSLESSNPGVLHVAYKTDDLNADNRKELIFYRLIDFDTRTLKKNIVFKLNRDGSNYLKP